MKKIMLIGSGGAGKSTLAKQLGKKLNINVYHLDSLFWLPHWQNTDITYKRNIQNELLKKSSWIIDGNYSSTLAERMQSADTIIYLQRSRWVCLYHVVKRWFKYRGQSRPDMQQDCPEHLDFDFLKWVWNFSKRNHPTILKQIMALDVAKQVIILKNTKQIQKFLQSI